MWSTRFWNRNHISVFSQSQVSMVTTLGLGWRVQFSQTISLMKQFDYQEYHKWYQTKTSFFVTCNWRPSSREPLPPTSFHKLSGKENNHNNFMMNYVNSHWGPWSCWHRVGSSSTLWCSWGWSCSYAPWTSRRPPAPWSWWWWRWWSNMGICSGGNVIMYVMSNSYILLSS